MRTSVSLALMLMLTIPSLAQAQEKNLLASAKISYRPLRGRYDEGPSKGPSI